MKLLQRFFAVLCLSGFMAGAAQAGLDEGIEYLKLPAQVPNHTDAKIEVVELFWYGCPHCFQFEPKLHAWLKTKPKDVGFVRVPAIFRPSWELHAQAYYTAEVLGVEQKMSKAIFDEIHVNRKHLHTQKELEEVFVRNGVSAQDFNDTFNSFIVITKTNRAKDLTRQYGINGVPSMVVNGKYMTDGPRANSQQGMLNVVDKLIEMERKVTK